MDDSTSLWMTASTAVATVGIVLATASWLQKRKSPSEAAASKRTKTIKRRTNGRCPFTAETDFIVETADDVPPTPWDLFDDWSSASSSIPADTASETTSNPEYKPLAARWLNAGISGQDTPGVLRAGLKRLANQRWFLVQDPPGRFVHELNLKRRNLGQDSSSERICYVQEEDSVAAQAEVLELFCHYLPKRYPDYFVYDHDNIDGPSITVIPLNETFRLADYEERPLELCARIVQEDLVLIRPPKKTDESSRAYHMAAAAVVFSFVGLEEKLGKPIEFIHAPVPEFEEQLRKTLELFFGKLLKLEQPLWRNNWVVTPESGGQLDAPNYGTDEADATRQLQENGQAHPTAPTIEDLQRMFLKVEYQTIRRLPRSGYLLFTVKMMVDRLRELEKVPRAAACLAKSIRGMSPAMRAYKGIGNGQDATYEAVMEYLDGIAGTAEMK